MPWPFQSADELRAAGYTQLGTKYCESRKCREPITLWRTPRGAVIPVNQDCSPHWESCPEADKFRRTRVVIAVEVKAAPRNAREPQLELFTLL